MIYDLKSGDICEGVCLDKLMGEIPAQENAELFSMMVSLAISGHFGDRLFLDDVSTDDEAEMEQAFCRYLRNIRLMRKSVKHLMP